MTDPRQIITDAMIQAVTEHERNMEAAYVRGSITRPEWPIRITDYALAKLHAKAYLFTQALAVAKDIKTVT